MNSFWAKPVPSYGIWFLPTLLGQNKRQKKHEYLYWEYAEKGGQLVIRPGQWKGVKVEMRKNKKVKIDYLGIYSQIVKTFKESIPK